MDIVERATVKLAFHDQYLAFVMSGIKCVPVKDEITYFGSKFIMAIVYDAYAQEFSLQYNLNHLKKEKYTLSNVVALLEHELGHVLSNHFGRQEDREPVRWNIAGDMALDQNIKNIPRTQAVIDEIKKKYNNLTSEEIYWRLPTKPKEMPKSVFVIVNSQTPQQCPQCGGDGQQPCPDCHGEGEQDCKECNGTGEKDGKPCENCGGDGKEQCETCKGKGNTGDPCDMCGGSGTVQNQPIMVPREEVRGVVDKLVKETTGKDLKEITQQHGHESGIWGTIAKSIESNEVDWKVIHKFLASLRDKRQRTLKKPSKRFPSPWGMRKRYEPKLTVAVDCSGSIGDVELDAFIAEINNLTMITDRINIIFADCSVQKCVENYKSRQKLGTIPGRGGTDYDPAIDYVNEQWSDTDLIVYLTDGECHPPSSRKRHRIPVVWVVTRNFGLDVKPMIKAPKLSKRNSGGW